MADKQVPHVGQTVVVRGVECEIAVVRPHGTIDVIEKNGERAWRVSGLDFTSADLRTVKCSLCDGHGSFHSSMYGPENCPRCGGLGEYDVSMSGRDERPADYFCRDDFFVRTRKEK